MDFEFVAQRGGADPARGLAAADVKRAVALAAAALGLAGCQPAASGGGCRLAMVTSVPLTVAGAHVGVPVTLNGHQGLMLFDTGSNGNFLSPATAREVDARVDINAGFAPHRISGIGGSRSGYSASIAMFELGAIKARDVPFVVLAGMHGDEGASAIGMTLFEKTDLDIDVPDQRLSFYIERGGCGQPVTTMQGSLYPVARTDRSGSDDIEIPVTIAGHELTALLDTGSPQTTILAGGADKLGLAAGENAAIERHGVGPGVAAGYRQISAPISIGDLTISHLPVGVLPDTAAPGVDMLLGLDFMQRVHVWVSQSSHTLLLQYPPVASTPPA